MAVIGSAHGTGGDVRVRPFTGDPMALGDYGLLYDENGRPYRLASIRQHKAMQAMLVVRFEGVDNRTQAQALNGTQLFIDRAQLPDDLEEDEYYHNDLIGFAAVDADGREIGAVAAFFNFGGGDVLELAMKDGTTRLVPFSRAAVPQVEMASGRIVVDPVAAGLAPDGDEDRPGV